MLELVNSREFAPVTLELNGAPHFRDCDSDHSHSQRRFGPDAMEEQNGSDRWMLSLALKERASDTTLQTHARLT